jgi:hypothetical protein
VIIYPMVLLSQSVAPKAQSLCKLWAAEIDRGQVMEDDIVPLFAMCQKHSKTILENNFQGTLCGLAKS